MINDFYSKLSDQEKKIFYVAVGIVLLMVLDRAFLGPVLSRMKSLDSEIVQQKNMIQRDLRFLSYEDRILKENEALKAYYDNRTKTVEEIIAVFLKNLEMMATQSKVNLIKVAPTDSQQKKGYVEYYASLECEGFFENLAAFMYAIDTSKDLLKIVKVSMGLKRASGEEILCNMVVAKIIIDSDKDFDSVNKVMVDVSKVGGVGEGSKTKQKGGLGAGGGGGSDGDDSDNFGSNSGGSSGGSSDSRGAGGQASESKSSSGSSPSSGQTASGSYRSSSGNTEMGEAGKSSSSSEEGESMPGLSSSSSQGDENVSQRFTMKGFKPKKGEKVPVTNEEAEPIRQSLYEKLMNRVEKEVIK